MVQLKSGYTQKGAALPKICRVITYMADKTFSVFNHEGDMHFVPVDNTDFSKWEEFVPPKSVADAVLTASGAKEVTFIRLTKEAQTRNTSGGFEA